MNTFFTELAKSMNEGQVIDMRFAKTGEELTFLVTTKGKKNLNGSGTPEELDEELINHVTTIPERTKGLKATTSEPEKDEDEDEDDADDKSDRDDKKATYPAGSEKGRAAAKAAKEKASKPASKKVAEKSKEIKGEAGETSGSNPEPLPEVKTEAEANTLKVSEPVKAEPKVDVKAESARIDNEFTVLMHEGKTLFGSRLYQESMDKYQAALLLKPENPDAIAGSNNAYKWVKAVANL